MKVNPTTTAGGGKLAGEEKSLLSNKIGGSFISNLTGKSSKSFRRQDKRACNKLLRKIVDGQAATIVMSIVTLYALFGVIIPLNDLLLIG